MESGTARRSIHMQTAYAMWLREMHKRFDKEASGDFFLI